MNTGNFVRVHPSKSAKHIRALPLSSAELEKQIGQQLPTKPDWLRINDAVRLFSISRSSLYELISEGKIKSAVLKKKGNIRGIRLLSSYSLDALLASLAEGGRE